MNRLIDKYPNLTQNDTVLIHDTLVLQNAIHDTTTVIESHDTTIVINNEKVELRYFYDTLTREIHHYVECKADTIIREIPVTMEKVVYKELSLYDRYKELILIIAVLIAVIFVLGIVKKFIF